MIFGISTRFGHIGVTITVRSPGPTSACVTSISADIPEFVTVISSTDVARCSRDT